MLTREQIAARAAREIQNGASVFLDPAWAELVRASLGTGVAISEASGPQGSVDVAVVAATTSTLHGELGGTTFTGTASKVVAVIAQHQADDGTKHLLQGDAPGALKANLLITNLAVFEVTAEGLVMREVAQGVSALDVQLQSDVNLLAADDLRVVDV